MSENVRNFAENVRNLAPNFFLSDQKHFKCKIRNPFRNVPTALSSQNFILGASKALFSALSFPCRDFGKKKKNAQGAQGKKKVLKSLIPRKSPPARPKSNAMSVASHGALACM